MSIQPAISGIAFERKSDSIEAPSGRPIQSRVRRAAGIAAILVCCVSYAQTRPAMLSGKPDASRRVEVNPFEKHVRVAERIYVYDRSLFLKFEGPVLSPWNPDPRDGVVERKKLGTILVSPSVRLNIELVTQTMGETYEFSEIRTGKLFHKFSYFGSGAATLLFTGQGVVYEHARVDSLCWGTVTRKYEFQERGIVETSQPILLIGADTELLRDVKLLLSKDKSSAPVATLTKNSKATVLTYESPDRFLLKTPLGLTGWIVNDRSDNSLSIAQCS